MSGKPPEMTAPVRIEVMMVAENDKEPVPQMIESAKEASVYAGELRRSDREVFATILLDVRNRALGLHRCTVGTLSNTLIDAGSLFKAALLANASKIVMVHNHPSEDSAPSAEDLKLTRVLLEAGEILGIKIMDHVILGRAGSYHSMRDTGMVEFP